MSSILGLTWTAIAMGIGVGVIGMAAPEFLVTVTVPFLFGTIVVLNSCEGSLLGRLAQPVRGVVSVALAAAIGVVLARMYVLLLPHVSGDVPFGAPGFQGEVWLASALLSVTFPFLVFHADFFGMWPFRNPQAETADELSTSGSVGR